MNPPRSEVQDALAMLHDSAGLATCALSSRIPEVQRIADAGPRGLRLRALLLNAIEVLRPLRRYPFGSLESRAYDVLSLRYVEDMTARQVATELSLSERQVHRDLWVAETKLCSVLAGATTEAAVGGQAPADILHDELQAFRGEPAVVDVRRSVRSAVGLVLPLAEQLGVSLGVDLPEGENVAALADEAVLTQVLAQALSFAVQSSIDAGVRISASADAGAPRIDVRFAAPAAAMRGDRLKEVSQIASAQCVHVSLERGLEPGEWCLSVAPRVGTPRTVLVVEDNAGALELYRRYLTPAHWQVHGAPDPRVALDVAARLRPDVIVLDIMLPHLDGWSVLKALTSDPATARIPVVMCSIVHDPTLSRSLGARAHLAKPVSRGALLSTLNACLEGRQVGG